MDNENKGAGGSLRISQDVIATIAKIAAKEIDGVADVSVGDVGVRGLFDRVKHGKPIKVTVTDGVADVEINIIVAFGTKISKLTEAVQENIKNSIQSMTGVAVSRVNVVIAGVERTHIEKE